jgi:hypothetical protein
MIASWRPAGIDKAQLRAPRHSSYLRTPVSNQASWLSGAGSSAAAGELGTGHVSWATLVNLFPGTLMLPCLLSLSHSYILGNLPQQGLLKDNSGEVQVRLQCAACCLETVGHQLLHHCTYPCRNWRAARMGVCAKQHCLRLTGCSPAWHPMLVLASSGRSVATANQQSSSGRSTFNGIWLSTSPKCHSLDTVRQEFSLYTGMLMDVCAPTCALSFAPLQGRTTGQP